MVLYGCNLIELIKECIWASRVHLDMKWSVLMHECVPAATSLSIDVNYVVIRVLGGFNCCIIKGWRELDLKFCRNE